MSLKFEWDEGKAGLNRKKHKIDFEEAQTVFADSSACIFNDEWHSSIMEQREIIIGHSLNNRILLVCFTEIHEKTIRIISARKATQSETKKYERNNPFKS
jgi:hypothetical protein